MISGCLVALLCGALPLDETFDRPLVEERAGPITQTAQTPSHDEVDVDFKRFHETLGWTFTRGLISTENLWPFVIGAGASLAAVPIDEELSDELRGRFDEWGEIGHFIGHPVTIAASVGVLVVAAPLTENRRFRAFSYSLVQAQILDSTLTYGLKAAVSRTRPNGENNNAFPSGHAGATFAFATVAGHYYGKKVSIPGYVIASVVGASRIEKGKHYLSDVIFGATLGYITGRTAVRGTEGTFLPDRITFHPMLGHGRSGVIAQVRF